MKIETVPALELLGGLHNYALRDEEEEDVIESSEDILVWRKNVEKRISPFLSSDIEQLFRCRTPYTLLVYIAIQYDLQAPDALITWLSEDRAETLRNSIVHVIGLETGDWDSLTMEQLRELLERDDIHYHQPVEADASLLLFALQHPDAFQQRLLLVVSDFYRQFIQEDWPEAQKKLEEKRAMHQRILDQNPKAFLNQITLDNYESMYSSTGEYRLIITYYANRIISLFAKLMPIIMYGFDVEQLLISEDIVKQNDQCIKALSDPKRAAILRLLKRRQWYGKELADHFGLTTATMSYHMDKLISSRLVRFEMGEKNRILYSLNREGIETMLENLRKDCL